jgi:RNA polymerase sigma-70 factor, ECF subfamily
MRAASDSAVQERDAKGSCVSPEGQNDHQEFSPTRVERDEDLLAALRGREPTAADKQFEYQAGLVATPHAQLDVPLDRQLIPAKDDRDWRLVEALRLREPTAAERLVATYGDRTYRLAVRITGDNQDAEEAVQDAFWSVVRKIDTFRGEAAFGSWVFRIVSNAAYRKVRQRPQSFVEISPDEVLPAFDEDGRHAAVLTDWSSSIDDPAVQSELRAVLSSAISGLPAHYRAVIVLHDIEGLSMAEVAEAVGITVPTAKTRAHRARLWLRKRLSTFMASRV